MLKLYLIIVAGKTTTCVKSTVILSISFSKNLKIFGDRKNLNSFVLEA
jgi:hypothetical protein